MIFKSTAKSLKDYYNQSDAYLERMSEKTPAAFDLYLKFIGRYVGIHSGRLLDIGCGAGLSSWLIAQRFPQFDVVGGDLSEKFINYAKSNYILPNLRYELMDACDINLHDRSIDAISSKDVIEHVPDVEKHLQECDRVLKPGGYMLIMSPNLLNPIMPLYLALRGRKWHGLRMTVSQSIAESLRISQMFLHKLVSSSPFFNYRKPILDDAIHTADDVDSVFLSNPLDLGAYFGVLGNYHVLNLTLARNKKQRMLKMFCRSWLPVALAVRKKTS